MPEEMYGKSFDKLFKFLLDKGLVTLGLYRLKGAQDNFTHPYVFTNPGPKTIVTPKDRIFVLGKDIPKDFIIDFSRRGGQEAKHSQPNEGEQKIGDESATKDGQSVLKDFYGTKKPYISPF
mgnify:CR=1 FL=1